MPTPPDPTIVRVDRPDFTAVREQAQAEVRAELAALVDLNERGHRAGQIVAQADAHLSKLRPERDSLALSLWAYANTRALELSMGVIRPSWVKIQRQALGLTEGEPAPRAGEERSAAARAAGVTARRNAAKLLPTVAVEAVKWQARREAAKPVRDDTARELVTEAGWTRDAAMQVVGIGSKAVMHDVVHADGTPAARYPKETRDEAVRQVLEEGLPAAEVARRMDLNPGIVRYWVRAEREKRARKA
jgi:hypothetical protein